MFDLIEKGILTPIYQEKLTNVFLEWMSAICFRLLEASLRKAPKVAVNVAQLTPKGDINEAKFGQEAGIDFPSLAN